MNQNFDLTQIADHLESLEEKIIFNLLNRTQYQLNEKIYQGGEHDFIKYFDKSLLEVRLFLEEEIDARFNRFAIPEERPFFDLEELPRTERSYAVYEDNFVRIDDYDRINLTEEVKEGYLDWLKKFCDGGDDGHYGSSTEHDVKILKAISERVHYASFYVAEAKYRQEPEEYERLIAKGDKEGIYERLTRVEVEEKILGRVREKADNFQRGINLKIRHYLEPELLEDFYRDFIIPLSKRGEVKYFLGRG